MYLELRIPDNEGVFHCFSFNFYSSQMSKRFEVKDVCIIDVYKAHDHRYDFKAFFYKRKYITHYENIRSKKELYSAIQKLLKQNLYEVIQ